MISLYLIIDGNYFINKLVHILHKNKILYSELYNVMERDYGFLTKLYPFDRIYFVSDSFYNWRKEFFTEYKGTRKKDLTIDWQFVYKEYDRFKDYLRENKKNCDIQQIENLEGDDIVSYLVDKINEKGGSVFLMSNDSDLLQMIKYDVDKRYMNIMYNFKMSDDKVFVPEYYKLLINHIRNNMKNDDIFGENNEVDYIDFFDSFLSDKKIELVDSEKELFMKIMGHNKDNIKSVYMKGDKGIGKIGILKLYELYKQTYPEPINFNSPDFKERLIDHIKLFKRIRDDSMNESMLERLTRNLKIVKLDEDSIPKNLYEKMKKEIKI